MCKFFSFLTDGDGNYFYLDYKQRSQLKNENCDSHTFIASVFKINEDIMNKYEYDPLTKVFTIDQINAKKDDSKTAEKFVRALDFKEIIPELIIKDFINPLKMRKKKPTKKDIELLKKWSSVTDSVGNSVWASFWNSVGSLVRDLVGSSVTISVWNSVRNSVGSSVRNSVCNLAIMYISSFFDVKYEYDFSPAIKLWERGFVPSFDGAVWRLHSGKNMDVVYEMK